MEDKVLEEKNEDIVADESSSEEEKTEERKEFDVLLEKNKGDYRKALFEYCFTHNIVYAEKIYKRLLSSESSKNKFPRSFLSSNPSLYPATEKG